MMLDQLHLGAKTVFIMPRKTGRTHVENLMKTMDYYVIYEKPSDYPGFFVVRHYKNNVSDNFSLFDTLEEARSSIPKGLTVIGRDKRDDPVIVETWL